MRMAKYYMPTLRQSPQDAEIASHKLLLRAGMIRRSASGIYSYLPLGYRVVRKIENIVREEMDRAGSQEILMSAIQPKEIWEESGRWKDFGPEMFKLTDRNDRDFCLGPTAEEYFTTLIKDEITSYKQLPLNIYQIQTKYRDEKRPRFGINRAREFLMKDAYSFDTDENTMRESYMVMWHAYERVFDRLKLEYRIVAGDSGAMGGDSSHEFIALSDVGEGVICYAEEGDYAATDEKAKVVYKVANENEAMADIEECSTPGTKTIEEVTAFFGVESYRCLKAVDFKVEGKPVIVFIPGDRELNMAKLQGFLKVPEHEIEMLDDETIVAITGANPGFTGPIGLRDDVRVIVDSSVTKIKNMITGANRTDYHKKNVNFGRDFTGEVAEDLLMVKEGDVCPVTGSPLVFKRGIEVGNIFQLGIKYSSSLNANYLDQNGKANPFFMGSYGIGVTRSVTAVIEQNNDDNGIIWPIAVAPYHAIITVVNVKDEAQLALAEKMYAKLSAEGIEVMLDDRAERVGVKFNDRDLIGIPLRVTVGKMAPEGIIEYSERTNTEHKEELSADAAIERICEKVRAALNEFAD